MKYLSLFSGIGGFELGINQAYEENWRLGKYWQADICLPERQKAEHDTGAHISFPERCRNCAFCSSYPEAVGYSEIDKYATQIYEKHFNHKNYGDITKINEKELPDFDLLVGGFPCQAFSIAGQRKGFEDTRGTMFFEIARIVREKQPRLLLLENVKGLLSHDKGHTFYTIISTLDELGYDLQWQVLNSKNHGVPQNRERVFIIGHLRGTCRPEVFPFGGENQNDTRRLGEQISLCLDANYFKGVSPKGYQSSKRQLIADGKVQIRRLTPTECERLQGFPDGWTEGVSDTQRYKTLGNAVTVNVIQDIMKCLI